MKDTISILQDQINDNFISISGTTETYSYEAVIKAINFFIENFTEGSYKTKVIPVTDTKGIASFCWINENGELQEYSFIYLKNWRINEDGNV